MPDKQIDNIEERRAPSPVTDGKSPANMLDGEASFMAVFRNHAAIMLLFDAESSDIVEANPAAAEFYGWPVERLCSMNMREIDAPSWTRDEEWSKKLAAQGQGRFVSMHRRADGSLRYVEVCYGSTWLHGKTALFCIVQDHSERQHFEALTGFRLRLLEMVESASTEELLTFTLDEAERLTGSSLGFFNFVSNDQTLLRHACSTNAKTDNCGHAPHPTVIDLGVSADVISEKEAVIHNDHATLRHCNCKFAGHPRRPGGGDARNRQQTARLH